MIFGTSRRRLLRSFAVVLLGLAVGLPLLGFHPWAGLQISPATTFITSPLDASGFPDFAEFFNAKHRVGVTPENNAAIVFLGHLTGSEIDQMIQEHLTQRKMTLSWDEVVRLREEFQSELGLCEETVMPPLVKLSDMGSNSPEFTPEILAAARAFLFEIRKIELPQSQSLPEEAWRLMEQWVEHNEDLRQRVAAESHRERYYCPLVSLGREAAYADIELRCLNQDVEICHVLRAHAELRLRAGDQQGAVEDACTQLRYAQLHCQSSSPGGIVASRYWANDAMVIVEKLGQLPGGAELVRKELCCPMEEFQREYSQGLLRNHLPGMQANVLSFTLLLWSNGEIEDATTKRYPTAISINDYLRAVNSLFEEARPVFESGDALKIRAWVNNAYLRDKPVPNRLEGLANCALKPFRRCIHPVQTPQMTRHSVLGGWSNIFGELEVFERMEKWLAESPGTLSEERDELVVPVGIATRR